MSAPLAIVIPTLNAADALGPCLGALTEGVIEGLVSELVLADGGSDDGIEDVADALGARLVRSEPGRGTQLAVGAAATNAPWLLFLHADTVLAPGWSAAVQAHIASDPSRAAHFRLRFDSRHPMARITEGWANLRSAIFGLPYGDQGLVISRKLYREVGGYPPQPLMEDVALVRGIGRKRLAALPVLATTSAERYDREGWFRRGWRNLTTLGLYLLFQADPKRLAKRYHRSRSR